MNAQVVMALLDHGNDEIPRSGSKESARALEERLMTRRAERLTFRSALFSAVPSEGRGPWAYDSLNHAVLLGPALGVRLHARDERAVRARATGSTAGSTSGRACAPIDRDRASPPSAALMAPCSSATGCARMGPDEPVPSAPLRWHGEARCRDATALWSGAFSKREVPVEHSRRMYTCCSSSIEPAGAALQSCVRGRASAERAHAAATRSSATRAAPGFESELTTVTARGGPRKRWRSASGAVGASFLAIPGRANRTRNGCWLPVAPLSAMARGA